MKKAILTSVIISALLMSCNETKHKHDNSESVEMSETAHQDEAEDIVVETHTMSNAWINEIKLDEGDKWEANSETTEGVDKMLSLLKSSDSKTLEDYHSLASKLNIEKNFVIKECTMKGPSHDNLHIFLHPLIEKIDALGKVSTTLEGAEIKESIRENLDGYNKYFQ